MLSSLRDVRVLDEGLVIALQVIGHRGSHHRVLVAGEEPDPVVIEIRHAVDFIELGALLRQAHEIGNIDGDRRIHASRRGRRERAVRTKVRHPGDDAGALDRRREGNVELDGHRSARRDARHRSLTSVHVVGAQRSGGAHRLPRRNADDRNQLQQRNLAERAVHDRLRENRCLWCSDRELRLLCRLCEYSPGLPVGELCESRRTVPRCPRLAPRGSRLDSLDQRAQRVRAGRLDLQREQVVGARAPAVDRGDRLVQRGGTLAEPVARVDHQRRTDDKHRVRRVERTHRRVHPRSRHALAEEHDIRLQHAAATWAGGDRECIEIGIIDIGVAVGRRARPRADVAAILRFEHPLHTLPRLPDAAFEADDATQVAVQLDDIGAAGTLVQPVDVLRDKVRRGARRLQTGERAMRGVGPRSRDQRPADHAARPVAPPRRHRAQVLLQRDRRGPLPLAVVVAIARNARVGADPCSGQHEQSPDVAAGNREDRSRQDFRTPN